MKHTNKRMISLIFTLAIIALIYLSGPSTAIDVALGRVDDLFRGQVATITGNITLSNYEYLLNSGSVVLQIAPATNTSFTCSLPLTTSSGNVICSNGQVVTVTSVTSSTFEYGYGYGYDFGYGYSTTYGYNTNPFGYGYGYGYGYSNVWQSTDLQYTVKWAIPSTYGNGTFTATISVYAGGTLITSSATTFNVKSLTELPRDTVKVRISEVMANPVGDDSASKPNGEWVELQNTGNATVNVSGWKIVDAAGTQISITDARTNTGATTISASGFLAVYMNAAVLNNEGDVVNLYHSNGTLIDVFSYNAEALYLAGLTDGIIRSGSPGAYTYSFVEGYSLILTSATSASECTGGLFLDGQCYKTTNVSTPGESNPGMEETLTKSLADVWNLISIPVTLTNKTVQSTLSSIDGKYSIVWGYNASDTSDPWKKYVPGASIGNDLSEMGVEWGYWVRVNSTPATLNVSGNEPTSTNIPIVDVWNLVGYPKLTAATNVSTALNSIDGNYTIVWGYNASDV